MGSEKSSPRGDKRSEGSDMSASASAEARYLVRRCAEPVKAGESVKALIRRVAMRTGLSPARVKSFWYEEAKQHLSHEMDRLRQMAAQSAKEEENAAMREREELRQRLVRIEAALFREASEKPDSPVAE